MDDVPGAPAPDSELRESPPPRFRWVPWTGRPSPTDIVLIAAILVVVAIGAVLRPLQPFFLASHPALLAFVTGDLTAVGATAAFARVGDVPLWLALVAGVIGMTKFDWLTWWIGRRWGYGILSVLATESQARRWSAWAKSADPRLIGAAVALAMLPGVPTAVVFVLAGWTGMRLVVFLLLDLLGAAVTTALIVGIGYAAGQHAVDLVLLIDRYASVVSLSLIGIAVAVPLVKRLARRLRAGGRRRPARPDAAEGGGWWRG
jgi:membrane protein DedA with SNARE-associated domain